MYYVPGYTLYIVGVHSPTHWRSIYIYIYIYTAVQTPPPLTHTHTHPSHTHPSHTHPYSLQIRNVWSFEGKIVWVSASAPVPQLQEKNFKAYKHFQTFAKCRCFSLLNP
jgi:hypothetical protein